MSTELHKKHLWMIFSSRTPSAVKEWARSDPKATLDFAAEQLGRSEYLLGDAFSVADAYLFWALLVAPRGGSISSKRGPRSSATSRAFASAGA